MGDGQVLEVGRGKEAKVSLLRHKSREGGRTNGGARREVEPKGDRQETGGKGGEGERGGGKQRETGRA